MTVLVSCVMPLAAFAGEIPTLQAETPLIDSGRLAQALTPADRAALPAEQSAGAAQPDEQATGTDQQESKHSQLLTGGVEKKHRSDANDPTQKLDGETSDDSANLKSESASTDQATAYKLALQKVQSGAKMTSDDYRALGVGVIGYESTRTWFQNEAVVTAVYPGLPAYEAGIRVGDKILVKNVDDSDVVDPTKPKWVFSCGIAGTGADFEVKQRDGQIHNVHLVRANMEDIPDLKLRRQYEHFVSETGAPADNVEVHDFDNSANSTGKTATAAKFILRSLFGL